jgi:hypothetical protein
MFHFLLLEFLWFSGFGHSFIFCSQEILGSRMEPEIKILQEKMQDFRRYLCRYSQSHLTISAVDWMMSLEPHWFSTIFGVYLFAGSTWVALAAITLIVILLHEKGYLHKRITTDHYYSLGTLLFAFTVFWGYIAFSQYMLIWYADLPEETFWFALRWQGGWLYLSVLLMISHFLVPFIALLSFAAKTNPKRLKFMSIWILAAHFIDLYWLIMPTLSNTPGGYTLSWMDAAYPAFVIGLLIIVFNMRSKKDNLIPIGDPKLERGLDFRL